MRALLKEVTWSASTCCHAGTRLLHAVHTAPARALTPATCAAPCLPPDALRCIKALDGAVWKGRQVKACFGTTKYCNAFLKGVPCNNHDCLYLHELGARRGQAGLPVWVACSCGACCPCVLCSCRRCCPRLAGRHLHVADLARRYRLPGALLLPEKDAWQLMLTPAPATATGLPCLPAADEADCLTKEEVAAGLLPARFMAMGGGGGFKPRLAQHTVPAPHVSAAGCGLLCGMDCGAGEEHLGGMPRPAGVQ